MTMTMKKRMKKRRSSRRQHCRRHSQQASPPPPTARSNESATSEAAASATATATATAAAATTCGEDPFDVSMIEGWGRMAIKKQMAITRVNNVLERMFERNRSGSGSDASSDDEIFDSISLEDLIIASSVDDPIRLTGGCPSDIEEEEDGEGGEAEGGNVACMPSAAELRRRQEVEANERAAWEYQAHYDAEAQREAQREEEEKEEVNLMNPSYANIDEVYAASAAGVTVAEARNNPVQSPPQVQDALSSSDDDDEDTDAHAAASSAGAGTAAAASASGTRDRSNTNISNLSMSSALQNCKRPSPHGKRDDTMLIRSETNAKNVKAKKTRQEPAVIDTPPFVPRRGLRPPGSAASIASVAESVASVASTFSCMSLCQPTTPANSNWMAKMCRGKYWHAIKRMENKGDFRGPACRFQTHTDDPTELVVIFVQNFPSDDSKCASRIINEGIAYLNSDGLPGQKSWNGICVPLKKLLCLVYGKTDQAAVAIIIGKTGYMNLLPIMGNPDWQSNSDKRSDYLICRSSTDGPVYHLMDKIIGKCTNLEAVVGFGSPFYDTCIEGNGAFGRAWFDQDHIIQTTKLPHGSQLTNGRWINETQRDRTVNVLNKVAALLVGCDVKEIPESMKDEILPFARGGYPDGTMLNSRTQYIVNDLSTEQEEELRGYLVEDGSSLLMGGYWGGQRRRINTARQRGQTSTYAIYWCSACGRSDWTYYGQKCYVDQARCSQNGKEGTFNKIKLNDDTLIDPMFRGFCLNAGCHLTGLLNQEHQCSQTGKKLTLTSMVPPSDFVRPSSHSRLLVRKVVTVSGELKGTFDFGTLVEEDLNREFGVGSRVLEEFRSQVRDPRSGRKPPSLRDAVCKVIKGVDGLQTGVVQIGQWSYCGVPINLPINDDDGDNSSGDDDSDDGSGMMSSNVARMPPTVDNHDDSNDDDNDDIDVDYDSGDSSDGMKKPTASARLGSSSQKKLSSLWAKKPSAAPKKSNDDDDDNSNDDKKPAAVPKQSSSKMKLDFGVKKPSAPPKDSKSKSRGTKEPTVGKKSSSDASGRIDGCSCGPYSMCLTKACRCWKAGEDCDPKRCKCNCKICKNKGRKSSGNKGDGKGKKLQMKLPFFRKKSG